MSAFAPWPVAVRAERLILELRELLVRFDENEAAWHLLDRCVPHYLHGSQRIAEARERQREMVAHLLDPDAYRAYYADNPRERPFEEQKGCAAADAHAHVPRVAWLRERLALQHGALRVLDLACNDGWLAENLHELGLRVDGLDLGVVNIERAMARRLDVGGLPGEFRVGRAEDAARHFGEMAYDAVVAFEVVEHVPEPDRLLAAMVDCCAPAGRLYVSTPLGTDHRGDLPNWDVVERKGHLRVYIPETFQALLLRHGEIVEMVGAADGTMFAEVMPK